MNNRSSTSVTAEPVRKSRMVWMVWPTGRDWSSCTRATVWPTGRDREELQEERDDEHLGEQPPVLHHRRDEPREVEPALRALERGTPGQEHEPPGPQRTELLDVEQAGRARALLHEHPCVGHPREHQESSVAKLRDGRKGDFAETPQRGLHRAGLQAQPARCPNHVRHRHWVPGWRMLAGNLPRVGRQAVKPQHGGKTRRARVDGLRVVSGWRRERARQPGRPAAGERRHGQLAVDRCRGTGLTSR